MMASPSAALTSPSVARNREPILAVLRPRLPLAGLVLEIAAGTGEHAAYFAAACPFLTWQPADLDPEALASIAAWRAQAGLPNLLAPLQLDARDPASWPNADVVVAINMIHISPWQAVDAMRHLPPAAQDGLARAILVPTRAMRKTRSRRSVYPSSSKAWHRLRSANSRPTRRWRRPSAASTREAPTFPASAPGHHRDRPVRLVFDKPLWPGGGIVRPSL